MTDAFPLPLRGKYIGKDVWELLEPFEYHSKKYGTTRVPVGFTSDGASFPKIVYSIMGSPWGGKYSKPAVIHDFLYFKKYNRKKADKIFLEAMKISSVSFWKRRIIYRMLRLFGWLSWRKNRSK